MMARAVHGALARRECLAVLVGATASCLFCPPGVRAQRPSMPLIGFLSLSPSAALRDPLVALHGGLKEAGYVEGQNVAFEYRSANDRYDRLTPMAAELARRPVTVIVVSGGNVAAVAAKAATATIPIVFTGWPIPSRAASWPVSAGRAGI